MALALRGDVPRPYRWAFNWYLGVLLGVAAAWFSAGGLAGASTESLHPIFENAVAHGWHRIPESLLGALVYGAWTAAALPTALGEMVSNAAVTARPDREPVSKNGIQRQAVKACEARRPIDPQMLEERGAPVPQAKEIVDPLSRRLTPNQMHGWLSHRRSRPVPRREFR